ncbi:MAG: PAS domain S-box protein [Nibricoccus sp.]
MPASGSSGEKLQLPHQSVRRSYLTTAFAYLIVAVLYGIAARLGLLLASLHNNVSPVWPATGVAIGILLVAGRSFWLGILIGAFVANYFTAVSWQAALSIAAGNTLEAVMGAVLVLGLQRTCGRSRNGPCPVSFVTAALVAPIVSAGVGVGALVLAGELVGQDAWTLGVTWWVGDALGALGLAPLIFAVHQEWRSKSHSAPLAYPQMLALAAATAGVCWLSFSGKGGVGFLFAVFPLLLLATVWFGPAGSLATALVVSLAGVVTVMHGLGPFVGAGQNSDLLRLQFFMAVVLLMALVLPQFLKRGSLWMPVTVMLVGWTLSGWMFSSLVGAAERIDRAHFKELVADATDRVAAQASSYQDALRAGVALIGASETVERREWASISQDFRLAERYPGVLGIGLVTLVPPGQLENFVSRIRQKNPDFKVKTVPDTSPAKTASDTGAAYIITYCEPFEVNAQAIGLDVASEEIRKAAADTARDTGLPSLTRRIKLIQDDRARAGALMFAPFYRRGMVLDTVEDRRSTCLGWVYTPIIMELMLRDVLGRHAPELRMRVFEGRSIETRDLLFDTADASVATVAVESTTEIELGGQIFTLAWNRAVSFKAADRSAAAWAGVSAAFVSLLLALLVMSLQSTGQTAKAMVRERTAELEATNGLLQREVGERLRVLNSLRGTNQLQRAILDSTNYTIISTSREGVIVTFNAAAERLLGYRAEEMVGNQTPEIIHDHSEIVGRAEVLTRELGRIVEPGFEVFVAKAKLVGIDEREWTYIRKNGTRFPVLLSVTTLRDEQGEITGYMGIGHDLTTRKEADARIQRVVDELARQKFALDQHAIVAVTDVEGKMTYVNDKFCAISGYTRDELLGKTHRILKSGVHSETFYREMYETIGRGAVWQGELCNRAKNGDLYWEESTIVPFFGPDGKPTQYVAIRADITARKHLEESLARARDEALAASRLKSEFLATMSHEIRTPMNGVIGMAGMLMQSPLEGKQREMAEVIAYSARSLLSIINDILDFSKIEAGKFRIDSTDFNLRDAIEETVALLAPQASRKNLDLVCDISPALATGVTGDRGRLQQVLTNLLGNSIKFTEHGEVRITAQPVEPPGEKIKFRIEVEDTGTGIPETVKPLLFQPFVQADGSTTRKFGGTGLGLAISGQLINLMGGSIGFESLEGSGSHFWFTLSLSHVELPSGEALPLLPPGTRVLVVDDHELSETILNRQLVSFGCEVETAPGASEALVALQRGVELAKPYTVLLLDWNLPNEGALRLARDLRQDPLFSGVQILVLASAADNPARVMDGTHFQAVLTKPVREVLLHRSLLRIHGARDTASPFVKRPSLGGRGLSFLMAEDNTTNQIVAQMMIEQLGHTVAIASNGQEAVDMLRDSRYDAVLMDCQMPVLDGYEATRLIRSGRIPGINPRIPVIALTAYAMPGDRLRAIDAGMDDYISKPFESEMLTAALSRCGLLQGMKTKTAVRTIPATNDVLGALPKLVETANPKKSFFDAARREQLVKMKSSAGGSAWDKALGIFMKEMPARMQQLSHHTTLREAAPLSALAHVIVGSAANLGAKPLRTAAAALETAAKDEDWAEVQTALAGVELAWTDIVNDVGVPVTGT